MASKKEIKKLEKKQAQGKGGNYAKKIGVSSGKTVSPLGYKVKGDSKSWKAYDPEGRFNEKDIKKITKQMKGEGYSQVGINNAILKVASSVDPKKIGRSAMKTLPSLNTGYSAEGPAGQRKGYSGLTMPGYSEAGTRYIRDSQGKGGKKVLTWTGIGDSLDVGKYAYRAGGVSKYSWTPGEADGNRRGFGETIGQWDPRTGFKGKGGGQKSAPAEVVSDAGKGRGGRDKGGEMDFGGEDFGFDSTEASDGYSAPNIQGGAGTLAGANASGIRTRRSQRYRSGMTMRGTQQLNRMLINAQGLNV